MCRIEAGWNEERLLEKKNVPLKMTKAEMTKEIKMWRDLEEQCLFLRLPCKVGDTVWRIVPKTYKHIQPLIIESFIFDGKELLVKDNFGLVRSCETFGKTIFFTEKEAQSEAEEKLRKLEKNR